MTRITFGVLAENVRLFKPRCAKHCVVISLLDCRLTGIRERLR